MASGYEKADVGNPPGGEWAKPSRIGSAVGTTVVVVLSLAYWGAKAWALIEGVRYVLQVP
ncbi:hypothetical protein RCHOTPOCKET_3 [Rhodobacter phage RcHotPocket]|nr:hypothetical protein RCHOTPOCKET_3 [Rhodobacter phage RcHotPocket]